MQQNSGICTHSLISLGNLYIADYFNHRIRKVTASTTVISTIAGTGASSYSGDNGVASSAALYNPAGVAVDTSGKLILALSLVSVSSLPSRQRVHRGLL